MVAYSLDQHMYSIMYDMTILLSFNPHKVSLAWCSYQAHIACLVVV